MKTKSTNTKHNLPGFYTINGKITSMVFKAFCNYDFCPLQSISSISKVVIKKKILVFIPKTHIHLDDTKRTEQGAPTPTPPTHGRAPQPAPHCHAGWVRTRNQIIALILAKNNLSGLAGSSFQLRADFQHGYADTITVLGTSRPA